MIDHEVKHGGKKSNRSIVDIFIIRGCSPRVIDEQQVAKNEKIVIKSFPM
ncbi:hypothetical protein DSOL_3700 [Desulfosporosinus metallidurans]|uniref:Uncharacterized protein n=1 Tax=Desulfosporosinus metallidurans TaxID=1888891 RepID=A0A1Q8QNW9_9FIRM|nr:hypothetical protein DSOL_3700 [Desulfosporosinus metallidurans]